MNRNIKLQKNFYCSNHNLPSTNFTELVENNKRIIFFIILLTISLLSQSIFGQSSEESVLAKEGIIRLVPPQSPHSGGFVVLTNKTPKDIKLIRAESSISDTVELHDMKMEGGKMIMRPVAFINIPANSSVELKPGSLHIMFIGLKNPLKAGEEKKVSLYFDDNKMVSIGMVVREIGLPMK